jgi:hypothetical protein
VLLRARDCPFSGPLTHPAVSNSRISLQIYVLVTWACRERVEPCLSPRDPFYYCCRAIIDYRATTHACHACAHCLHRLCHQATRVGERKGEGTLCPCHVSLSFAQRFLQKVIDVTVIGVQRSCLVSVLTFERNLSSDPPYREGQLYAQPQLLSTPGPPLLLSIDAWTMVALLETCIDSSPWILRSPTFRPWEARKQKTLYDQHDRADSSIGLHSASRIRPLSQRNPVLSFLGPG